MKRFTLLNKYLIVSLFIGVLFSCDEENPTPEVKLADGIYITNEGNWGQSNGSVSYYNYSTDSVYNDLFQNINGRSVGDVVQSSTVVDSLIYIVVNGSNKIEIAHKQNLKEFDVITDLDNPRYLKTKNNIGYLSQWGEDGVITVINLSTNAIIDTIDVGMGPEQMEIINNTLFVANSGAYDRDSTVSVINLSTNEVVATIKVGDNPRDFAIDKNNKLWVLCFGYQQYVAPFLETGSKLVRINPLTNEVEKTIEIGETLHPTCIEAGKNADHLYIGGGYGFEGIFKFPVNDDVFPTTPIVNKAFYAIYVDASRDNIFGFDALNYASRGNMHRYDSEGNQLGLYEVGIIPNGSSSKKK